jgi:hypothetical protein
MSLKPNPKEINIILNILKGAQFAFLPWAPFYIDTPLATGWATEVVPRVPAGARTFSPSRPDRFWRQPSLLTNTYRGFLHFSYNLMGYALRAYARTRAAIIKTLKYFSTL